MAQDLAPTSVKVIRLEGPVRYSLNGGAGWKMLKEGEVFQPGVLIQTAKEKSSVDLELGGAEGAGSGQSRRAERAAWQQPKVNLIHLFADSALHIQTNSARGIGPERVEEIQLNLRAGQVLAAVPPTALESRYEITFDGGAVALQPAVPESPMTIFVLNASGNLAVLEGTMLMAKVDNDVHTQVVSAGERFDFATGAVSKLPEDARERKLWPPP